MYGHCLPTGFALYVSQRRSIILCMSSSRGGNLCESRSRIYRTNVFSSVGIKLCWALRSSAFEVRPFIRSRSVDSGMSYAFAAPLLQELGGARGLCVHPVIIVRLAPQISGLAEEKHAPLVRALKEQGPCPSGQL